MPLNKNLRDLATEARERGVDEVDAEELPEMLGDEQAPLVIDVREADERSRGYIPGSVGIPRGILERDIEKKALGGQASDEDLARPIVCYCGGGSRSLLAAERLEQMGFKNVASLEGGFKAWAETIGAVEI